MNRIVRRAAMALLTTAPLAWASGLPLIEVWRSPACGCCEQWVKHLQKSGFPTKVNSVDDNSAVRRASGMPAALGSCHTANVGGYVIEGHVPAKDIQRLLAQKPDARGLTAPGMPQGSPGMDVPNSPAYDVLLVRRDGTTEMFAHHAGSADSGRDASLSCRATAGTSPCGGPAAR